MSLSKNIGKCRKCGFPMYHCKCHFNTIAEPMSKEETPMTAEEFRKINNIEGEFTAYTKDGKRFDMHIDEFAEQYAQAKVLEREKDLKNMLFRAYCKPFTNDENKIEQGMVIALLERFDKYYETEVKPKYE